MPKGVWRKEPEKPAWPGEIVPVKDIREVVEAIAGLPAGSMMNKDRSRALSWHRQLVCHLAMELNALPTSGIGLAMGLDHTTVIYGTRRSRERVANDAYWGKVYRAARAALYAKRARKAYPDVDLFAGDAVAAE